MELRDVILTHVVGPIVFVVLVLRFFPISRTDALLTVAAVASPFTFLWLAGRWHVVSVWMRPVVLLGALGVLALSWRRGHRLPRYASKGTRTWVGRTVKVALVVFTSVGTADALAGRVPQGDPVELEFPLRAGRFYVGQGGSTPSINYHTVNRTQRYALDITKLSNWGSRVTRLPPRDLRDFPSYGAVLYAPCSGVVSHVEASLPDNALGGEVDRRRPAGNEILIRCDGTHVEVLMAHLQAGSVHVVKGEHVDAGRIVAAIGNSGNSPAPHLHIHAKTGAQADTGLAGDGVPMLFRKRFLVRNDVVADAGPE